MSSPVAVLGGLFDPVHRGHVSAAAFAIELLSLERLKMVPCHIPNHKARPSVQTEHRLTMLELATASHPEIEIDHIELRRDRVSYTVETLAELRQQHDRLVFVLGVDSFNSLPQWHDWESILGLCNLLVLSRPGSTLSVATLDAVNADQSRVHELSHLLSNANGKFLYNENFEFESSSSEIRKKLEQGADVSADLDESVLAYIREHDLYN